MGWFSRKPNPPVVVREFSHPVLGTMTCDSVNEVWNGRVPNTDVAFMILDGPEAPDDRALRAIEDWSLNPEPRATKAHGVFPPGTEEKLVRIEVLDSESPHEVCLVFKVPGDEWGIWRVCFDGEEIVGILQRDD